MITKSELWYYRLFGLIDMPPWQDWEIHLLQERYSTAGAHALAGRLHRSPNAVFLKASRLGLSRLGLRKRTQNGGNYERNYRD